jgi:anti-anti-sigma factor
MQIRKRAVNVLQAPNAITSTGLVEVFQRLEMFAQNGHPRFVLDCSKFEAMESREINFLLNCLEEAMKHNGDIRLADLAPSVHAGLRSSGVSHLFEVYDSVESAVHSYHTSPVSMAPLYSEVAVSAQDSEYAA